MRDLGFGICFFVSLILATGCAPDARAQSQSAVVVSACGTPPLVYVPGQPYPVTMDASGKLCTGASITPSGTQNVNVIQYGGNAVNASVPGSDPTAEIPHQVSLFSPASTAGVSTLTASGTKNLYSAYLTNTDTAAHYLWVVNTNSAPTNGTYAPGVGSGAVEDCIAVAAGQSGSINYTIPKPYSVQPYLANSTTGCGAASNTLTLSTVGFLSLLAK